MIEKVIGLCQPHAGRLLGLPRYLDLLSMEYCFSGDLICFYMLLPSCNSKQTLAYLML